MAIVKAKQKEYHARIPNATARDKDLSLKAKGLLCVLLSMDEDWKIYKKQIAEFSTDKYDATDSAFRELIEKGYIIDRGRVRGPKGYLTENLYEVFSEKQRLEHLNPNRDFPDLDNPNLDNPQLSNYTINSIVNKEKENKEVSLNINKEQSSFFGNQAELFEKEEPLVKTKTRSKKEKKEVHPSHYPIRKFWFEEFSVGTKFQENDGTHINRIIENIDEYLTKNGGSNSPSDIIDFFKFLCHKKIELKNTFHATSGLSVLGSANHFTSIVENIKLNSNGKSINNTRQSREQQSANLTAYLSQFPDPRKQR